MAAHEPWSAQRASALIDAHAALEGSALPVLHALQHAFGCVPLEAEPMVASALNLTRAEVHGIITFYHEFRRSPPGRHVVRVCRAEACQAVGGDAVCDRLRQILGCDWNGTSADGAVTLEGVFCLGLCASGPAALVDGNPVGRLDPARAAEMAGALA